MLFNSANFIFLYLPIVWMGYVMAIRLPWARAGIAWLALASTVFYVYGDAKFLPLLAASISFNYIIGRLLATDQFDFATSYRKAIMIISVCVNLGALVYYKYANLLSSSLSDIFKISMPFFDVILPIGISFYTFTQIAYIVDTYRSKKCEKSFIAYTLFVTFFPHLIAGPVLHHKEMMPQFLRDQSKALKFWLVMEGALIFSFGLAKKVLIADMVAPAANTAFAASQTAVLTMTDAWIGILAYTTQIYFDFSGYSDMAIGLGLLFGVRLPINFNSPYQSKSIVDFWRCWHMTLSRFLRDYLYIALGGNRKGATRRHMNLFATMVLGGLWHGASWTFLVWGALHGLYLQINHAWQHLVKRSPSLSIAITRFPRAATYLSWILTFLAVVVAWVFFRAESFNSAFNMLNGMFNGGALQIHLAQGRTLIYLTIGLAIAFVAPNTQSLLFGLSDKIVDATRSSTMHPLRVGMAIGQVLLIIITITLISASWGTNEFIYFNF